MRERRPIAVASSEYSVGAPEHPLTEVLPGRVCDVAVEQAKAAGADLIVLGTHGRRGVGRMLMGSDAEQILRIAPTPVLLVRADAKDAAAGPHAAAGAPKARP